MKNKLIFLIGWVVSLSAQELPSGTPEYFQIDSIPEFFQIELSAPSPLPRGLIHSIAPISYFNKDIYFLEIQYQIYGKKTNCSIIYVRFYLINGNLDYLFLISENHWISFV